MWRQWERLSTTAAVAMALTLLARTAAEADQPEADFWGAGTFQINNWWDDWDDGEVIYIDGTTTFEGPGSIWIDLHDKWSDYIYSAEYRLIHRVVNDSSADWTDYQIVLSPGSPRIIFQDLPELTNTPFTDVQISPDGYSITFSGGVVPHDGGNNFFDVTYTMDISCCREYVIIEQLPTSQQTFLTWDGSDADWAELIDNPPPQQSHWTDGGLTDLPGATVGGLVGMGTATVSDARQSQSLGVFGTGTVNVAPAGELAVPETAIVYAGGTVNVAPAGRLTVSDTATVRSGGRLAVDGSLTAATVVSEPGGTLAGSGTIVGQFQAGGTVAPGGSTGLLTVDGPLRLAAGGTYQCEIAEWDPTGVPDPWDPIPAGGPVNDKIRVTGSDAQLGGTLQLTAVAKLHPPVQVPGQPPGVMAEWYGDQVRTIVDAEGVVLSGRFDAVPDPQPADWSIILPGTPEWSQGHIGRGVFLTRGGPEATGIEYTAEGTKVHLFQAADGDTNGDRQLNGLDIGNILSWNTFPRLAPADWPQGDFTGDGWCDGADIQAILATGLYPFLPGPYAAVDPGQPADGMADLILYATDYDGDQYPPGQAGDLLLCADGNTINGYVVHSQKGIFTGEPPSNLGWFVEDTDRQISGNMGFILDDCQTLGMVVGPEWLPPAFDPFTGYDWPPWSWYPDDITFTYTIEGTPGTFVGNLIVIPEPGTTAMLLGGAVGLLACAWRRKRGRV